MVGVEYAKRWWRLSLTVLFAGILLPIFGMTALALVGKMGAGMAAYRVAVGIPWSSMA